MNRSVQVRIPKSEIESLVKQAILKEIEKVLKKTNVDDEIRMAVDDAVIDVNLPKIREELAEITKRLNKLEGSK